VGRVRRARPRRSVTSHGAACTDRGLACFQVPKKSDKFRNQATQLASARPEVDSEDLKLTRNLKLTRKTKAWLTCCGGDYSLRLVIVTVGPGPPAPAGPGLRFNSTVNLDNALRSRRHAAANSESVELSPSHGGLTST
jgi:hypothetical protein